MKLYGGIDLHSNNSVIVILDEKDETVYKKKHNNDLLEILSCLLSFQDSLQGLVVESTYNWYWLVDGLMEAGFKVHLANPAALQQYSGLKHTDDKTDARWLAHILRLGLLPEGYLPEGGTFGAGLASQTKPTGTAEDSEYTVDHQPIYPQYR